MLDQSDLSPAWKKISLLLQNSLWRTTIDAKEFGKTSVSEWKELMKIAYLQGVYVLIFDGIQSLPAELRPSKELLISWGLGVRKIENRYELQVKALRSISALFQGNNIRSLLLKGIGVSRWYPVPQHRESGDLDLYLFGEYAAGNQLMEQKGIVVSYDSSVHSKFEFENVPVENHASFFPLDWQKDDLEFEKILAAKMEEEPPVFSPDLGVFLPSHSFNLLYLYKHAVKHFIATGIVLRHLCDLALLLKLVKKEEYTSFYNTMKSCNLHRYADCFNSIIEDFLGVEFTEIPVQKDTALIQRVFNDLINQKESLPIPPRTSYLKLSKAKLTGTLFLFQNRWKYNVVDKKMFRRELALRVNIGLKHFANFNSK